MYSEVRCAMRAALQRAGIYKIQKNRETRACQILNPDGTDIELLYLNFDQNRSRLTIDRYN